MMFEILLAKIAHEVSLLHLERKEDINREPVIGIMEASKTVRITYGASSSERAYIWGCSGQTVILCAQ